LVDLFLLVKEIFFKIRLNLHAPDVLDLFCEVVSEKEAYPYFVVAIIYLLVE
jgi:hypothetical protein